ncbi:MAG: hypothetical protein M0010_00185 [Actinomycetota bacterium]|nr:hypothetical protein [Actinomycetota bacterium]
MPPGATEPTTLGNLGQPTIWGRLSQTFLRPPAPKTARDEHVDFSRMSDEEKRARIVGVDPTEKKIGIAASLLGILLAIYANVPYMVSKTSVVTTVKPKDKTCSPVLGITDLHYVASTSSCDGIYSASHYVLPLIVSLVLAIAIYVTVLIRRRAPLAFTIVMTGLAFGSLLVLVPYGVAGGWIMLRAWRTQKYGSPTARTAMTGWVAPPPRGTTRRARASAPRGRKGREATTSTTRKPPAANKRYTPKSPPKKKVAPPTS